VSPKKLFVPPVVLNRTAGTPLYRQICVQIAQAFEAGAIPRDARLPSTRLLARILRVSRNTAFAAYEELAADGLIRAERGSGTRIEARFTPPHPASRGLNEIIRDAHYPSRVLPFADPDGNPLYIRY
jgi:GntR family transcriptional regulator/MocR family aminotransferase